MSKKDSKAKIDPSITVTDDLKKLVCVFIITNRGLKDTLSKKIIRDAKAKYLVVFDAKDLVYKPNVIFERQMYDSSQEVFFIICQNARVGMIMEIVEDQCRLLVEAKARVLSVPLTSIINYNLFQLFSSK